MKEAPGDLADELLARPETQQGRSTPLGAVEHKTAWELYQALGGGSQGGGECALLRRPPGRIGAASLVGGGQGLLHAPIRYVAGVATTAQLTLYIMEAKLENVSPTLSVASSGHPISTCAPPVHLRWGSCDRAVLARVRASAGSDVADQRDGQRHSPRQHRRARRCRRPRIAIPLYNGDSI